MIEYAGVGLSVPDARVEEHLGEWWYRDLIRETVPDGYFSSGVSHLPRPYPPERRCPRPGVLYWPNGASRWAEFHHLVSQDQLTRIRAALGSGNGPSTFILSDGEGNSVSTSLYFLAARPVCRAGSDELFLLTLVDVRWYWWLAGDQSLTAAPATWADMFSSLMTKVGGSATADTADSDYSTPTNRWAVGRQPIPLLLDAAAASVGMRILRTTAGTVRVRNWTNAKADQETQITAHERHRVTGGRIEAADIARTVPASVASVFFAGTATAESHTSVTLASLALSEYAGATGVAGRVAQFWADMAASAGSSDRSNLATQAATDWYKWRLADWEAGYRGVVNWTHAGTEDAVEWEVCYPDRIVTRVLRGPWADPNVYGGPQAGSTFSGARVYHSANQSVTSGATGLYLDLDTETFDTDGYHSGGNPSRVAAPVSGYYHVGASITWEPNDVGTRILAIYKNHTTIITAASGFSVTGAAAAGDNVTLSTSTVVFLSAGEYVEIRATQDSGGNLNVITVADFSPVLWMYKVG